MKLERISERVKVFLESSSRFRDDDNLLIASIWKEDMDRLYPDQTITADLVFYAISGGQLSNSESIRRSRQRLQEIHENLRGDSWNERHGSLLCETLDELKKVK